MPSSLQRHLFKREDAASKLSDESTVQHAGWRRSIKGWMLSAIIAGLILSNVLTLTSDAAHTVGYQALCTVLASTFSDVAVSRLLSASPTAKRQQVVETATRDIAAANSRLRTTQHVLEAEHAALKKSFRLLEAERVALQRVGVARATAVQQFSQRQAIKAAARATRSVSALPGELIPWVGATVAVGLASWEVYDACATLRDLNELTTAFSHPPVDETRVCRIQVPTRDQALASMKQNWHDAYTKAAMAINGHDSASGNDPWPAPIPSAAATPRWSEMRESLCSLFGAIPKVCAFSSLTAP